MKPKIKVIDSIMGAGKTSFAIQMMTERTDVNFLYITPFLDEVERIKKKCACRHFIEPEKLGYNNKSDHFKELLAEGCNIASTHELFKRLDDEAMELIRANNYILVMDEVMQVLEPLESDIKEVESLLTGGILKPETEPTADNQIVKLTLGDVKEGFKKYDEYRLYAETGRLILCNGRILMWLFPADTFECFYEVWNLCYIFDGQIQKAYYDMHDLKYEYHSVEKGRSGKWKLIPYDVEQDMKTINKVRSLISIYEGKLNVIGESKLKCNPFSKSWLKKSRYHHPTIRRNVYNYFRNIVKAKSTEAMWTTFKDFKTKVQGNGFSRGFVGLTIRSTNSYRTRKHLAYLANIFLKPEIVEYFSVKDIEVNTELYALSEMIQWIWRSRIRESKSIDVYVPSDRMRRLLKAWLDTPLQKS